MIIKKWSIKWCGNYICSSRRNKIIPGISLHDLNMLKVGKFKYATAELLRPSVATVKNAIKK